MPINRLPAFLLVLAAAFGMSSAHAERLTEADIRLEVYRALYVDQGPRGVLPKVFVFASDGRCVGVLTPPETAAAGLWPAVDAALAAGVEACAIRRSAEFPGSQDHDADKPLRERVILVTMREDFCQSCADFRQALTGGLESRPAIDASIYTVILPSGPAPQQPK